MTTAGDGLTRTDDSPDGLTTIVAGRRSGLVSYARELVRFRDLLYFLVRRDIKVRYAQTILGFGWSVLQPFTQMVVFSVFFGALAGISSGGIAYPVFSLAAVVPWTYFSNAVTNAAGSLIGNANLVSKVYFPRILVPIAPIGAGLMDFAIGIVLLNVVMAVYGIYPSWEAALLLLPLVGLTALATAALAVWLSALGAQYRDVRYITPFFLQMLLFLTPVIYVVNAVPSELQVFYSINPMVGVVSGFRAAFLGVGEVPYQSMTISFAVSSALLAAGLVYFRRIERAFADIA